MSYRLVSIRNRLRRAAEGIPIKAHGPATGKRRGRKPGAPSVGEKIRARRIAEWNLRRDLRAGDRCARCWLLGHAAEDCDQRPEVVAQHRIGGIAEDAAVE